MEYTYFTITYPDYEGGTWEGQYRYFEAKDEEGKKYIEVEEGDESGWDEYQGFNTLRQMQAWIKRQEKDLAKYLKMLQDEAKENEEEYEERDIAAELREEQKRIEAMVAEYA